MFFSRGVCLAAIPGADQWSAYSPPTPPAFPLPLSRVHVSHGSRTIEMIMRLLFSYVSFAERRSPPLIYGPLFFPPPPLVKQLETVQMTAAKNILGCSSTTSNAVLRAELGMYPLETNRHMRKLKWQYIVRNMPGKRLPAIWDRTV